MTAAHPLDLDVDDPVRAALARAPLAEHDMSPEQRAEFAEIEAAYAAGTLRLVPEEDVPAVLEEIGRSRRA
jgi:hypothetical protein